MFSYLTKEPGPAVGINPAWWLHHRSLARTAKKNPYLLANEWIGSSLGWFLRLPIPPFALMRKASTSVRYFASLDYGRKETTASDMIPRTLCKQLPRIATGIVLFDILIGNPDRHEGNVKVDDPNNPTSVELIDQEHALFGHAKDRGIQRLQFISGKLGFCRLPNTCDVHKIGASLSTAAYFDFWVGRIESIPDGFIKDVVNEAKEIHLVGSDEADLCTDFLLQRKLAIRSIVRSNKAFFAAIGDWGVLYQ